METSTSTVAVVWLTRLVWPGGRGSGRSKRKGICGTVRYNLMYQHPSDWHNNTGIIRQADEQGMGIILMRVSARCGSWTSGVFQRLMAEAWATGGVDRLLLKTVLSDPYVDVAPVGGHEACLRGLCQGARHGHPEISDDVASRIDLAKLHDRYVR